MNTDTTTSAREGELMPVRDTELFVATQGHGPPVLVMHGGLGVDHTYFRPWLDRLADNVTLVYYDHRGNGRSARPDLTEVDHGTWVADADALRATLGHERIVVLGHSYGGFLALEYALAHPERVEGLVLIGTSATMRHWDVVHANLATHDPTPEQLRAFEDRPFSDDGEMAATLSALLPVYFHRPDDSVLGELRQMVVSVEASVAGGRCLADYDLRGELGNIDVPALVLGGRHDFIMPPQHTAVPLAAGLPRSELVVFEDSGHFPFIEETDHFTEVVAGWLARLHGDGR